MATTEFTTSKTWMRRTNSCFLPRKLITVHCVQRGQRNDSRFLIFSIKQAKLFFLLISLSLHWAGDVIVAEWVRVHSARDDFGRNFVLNFIQRTRMSARVGRGDAVSYSEKLHLPEIGRDRGGGPNRLVDVVRRVQPTTTQCYHKIIINNHFRLPSRPRPLSLRPFLIDAKHQHWSWSHCFVFRYDCSWHRVSVFAYSFNGIT